MYRFITHSILLFIVVNGAHATTVTLFEGDSYEWQTAVGHQFTTIDFTDGRNFTFINDDYADLGVVFSDNAFYLFQGGFPNDDWGMSANGGAWLTFDTPQHWIAADHPGVITFALYSGGELIYTSPVLSTGGFGGNFSGLVSSHSFDQVYVFKPDPPFTNIVNVDDLHFGTFIPAPGALGLLGLSALVFSTRRRRCADGCHGQRLKGVGRA